MLLQIHFRVVQQGEVGTRNQAEANAENDFVQQKFDKAIRPQQAQEAQREKCRTHHNRVAPTPDIREVAGGDFEQRDGQGEQCLGLQHLAHGQAMALQQRHEYGVHHHKAVEKSQQINGADIVMQ